MAWRPDGSVVIIGRDCAGTGRAATVASAGSGTLFGSTTTLVPTLTRLKRSVTSSLVRRMQPYETNFPIVDGSLVP